MLGMDMLVSSLLKATGFTKEDMQKSVTDFLTLIAESRATLVSIAASQRRIEQKLNSLLVKGLLSEDDLDGDVTEILAVARNTPANGHDAGGSPEPVAGYAESAVVELEPGGNRS